jgi:hypothetical protein
VELAVVQLILELFSGIKSRNFNPVGFTEKLGHGEKRAQCGFL